jgi:NTE family protein
MLLRDILQVEEYALCMSCGFFRFYAHMGVLHALEENDCLRVKSCSGSSAGALVTAFLATGMKPSEMPEKVFTIKRENMWDVGLGLGLLKGQLFQKILEEQFPVNDFKDCPIPLGVTAYDVLGFKTNCITTGNIATAVRASCCFPGFFQPVSIDNRLHIDGGVFDDGGLLALPSVPPSNLIVNVVCGRGRIGSSVVPKQFKGARLLTLVLDGIPSVSPFAMETDGPRAYNIARAATFRMLRQGHLEQLSHNHWCAYIDGSQTDLSLPLEPLPPHSSLTHSLLNSLFSEEQLRAHQNEEGNIFTQPAVINRRPSFQFHEKSRTSSVQSNLNTVQTNTSFVDFKPILNTAIKPDSSFNSEFPQNSISNDMGHYSSHPNPSMPHTVSIASAIGSSHELDEILEILIEDRNLDQNDPFLSIDENGSSSSELTRAMDVIENLSEIGSDIDSAIELNIGSEILSENDIDVDLDNYILTSNESSSRKRGYSEPEKNSMQTTFKKNKTKENKLRRSSGERKKFSGRLEFQNTKKILKRERKPSFKLSE